MSGATAAINAAATAPITRARCGAGCSGLSRWLTTRSIRTPRRRSRFSNPSRIICATRAWGRSAKFLTAMRRTAPTDALRKRGASPRFCAAGCTCRTLQIKRIDMNTEKQRLQNDVPSRDSWKYWGPYLSERQWGTVREDYSAHGNAWDYFPHDHARSRAYRWGEDGLAGFSDSQQRMCLSLAMWNTHDPILKERLFGLTNGEGNHGEDVKELYYYLDATPTHSYLKLLYKYPHREFPYARLIEENARRGKADPEFELLDTGIFNDDRYFDVFVEYAKAAPTDVLMRV